jgi:hypothetical protein
LEVGYNFLDFNGRRDWRNGSFECRNVIIIRLPTLQRSSRSFGPATVKPPALPDDSYYEERDAASDSEAPSGI